MQALEDSVTQEIAELKDKLAQLQGIIIEATNKLKHLRAEIVSLSRMKADASEVAQLHDEIQLLARLLTEQASGRSAPVPKEQTLERAHRAPALSPISLSSSRREPFTPVDVAPRSYSYLPPQQGFLTPPVVLEECLPELPLPWVKVAQDYRSGDFQESDEGKLILVKDGSLGGEERFVLPSQARFQQAQTYSRYASCYECQRPAGGKVRLLRLAVARRVAPQAWQVTIKGELEIM